METDDISFFSLSKARGKEAKANHDEYPKERSASEGYW
jgi:hypothetical protein